MSLIDTWNGANWTGGGTFFGVGTDLDQQLNGVSCPAAGKCFAVGFEATLKHGSGDFIARDNGGSWTSTGLLTGENLSGVTCVTTTNCTAVGGKGSNGLALHWNGSKWTTQTAQAAPGGRTSGFNGVACQSATSCWGVGSSTDGKTERRMVQHWNGSKWSIVNTPAPGTQNEFDSISCTATQCVAVGWSNTVPFIDSWNGGTWTTQSVPSLNATDFLHGVNCANATACVAVGTDPSTGTALVERRG